MITLPNGEVCSTGTITHGTMRSCDVIPALDSWLAAYATGEVRERYRGIVKDIESDQSAHAVMTGIDGSECEFADEIISDFMDLISESLPSGWTCMTHPGDGCDIGIWPVTMLDDYDYDEDRHEPEDKFRNYLGVRYVSVYLIDRAYGGPQEGGWWYDTGELIECHACPNDATAIEVAAKLERWCNEENAMRRSDIGSVLSEGKYIVSTTDTPGESYPKARPYYE